MFFPMQNVFIVPAMQHGCCAKPLFTRGIELLLVTLWYITWVKFWPDGPFG